MHPHKTDIYKNTGYFLAGVPTLCSILKRFDFHIHPLKSRLINSMTNIMSHVFEACVDGTLDQIDLQFEDNAAVCVVLASDGYPEHYEKGKKITGLENFKDKDGYYVFHAGSKFDAEGNILTNGGRVLGVTATGKDLKEARANA